MHEWPARFEKKIKWNKLGRSLKSSRDWNKGGRSSRLITFELLILINFAPGKKLAFTQGKLKISIERAECRSEKYKFTFNYKTDQNSKQLVTEKKKF